MRCPNTSDSTVESSGDKIDANPDKSLGSTEILGNKPEHIQTYRNNALCAKNENTDQPAHPHSLIWATAARMKKLWTLLYPWRKELVFWSVCEDYDVEMSIRCHFVVCWALA